MVFSSSLTALGVSAEYVHRVALVPLILLNIYSISEKD